MTTTTGPSAVSSDNGDAVNAIHSADTELGEDDDTNMPKKQTKSRSRKIRQVLNKKKKRKRSRMTTLSD